MHIHVKNPERETNRAIVASIILSEIPEDYHLLKLDPVIDDLIKDGEVQINLVPDDEELCREHCRISILKEMLDECSGLMAKEESIVAYRLIQYYAIKHDLAEIAMLATRR
jgi:hypothetical protein